MTVKPIIAGTDGSEESLRAVEWAAREAVLRKTALRIVSVPALLPRMSSGQAGRVAVAGIITQAARDALASAAERATDLEPGLVIDTGLLVPGSPGRVLLDQAVGASMLVLGPRGAGGLSGMLLGSVSRYLATRAPCPVVIAREETMAVHREIVVGVRDPGKSGAALELAFEEAAMRKARLLAVHAWFLPGVQPGGGAEGRPAGGLRSSRGVGGGRHPAGGHARPVAGEVPRRSNRLGGHAHPAGACADQ